MSPKTVVCGLLVVAHLVLGTFAYAMPAPLTDEQLRAFFLIIGGHEPPLTASAGNDIVQPFGMAEIQLDGSGSFHSNDEDFAYFWEVISQPEGADVMLSDPAAAMPSFTPGLAGVYEFRLTTTGPDGAIATDTVSVVLAAVPPTAVIQPIIRQPIVGTVLDFDGTSSSQPGDIPLNYSWTLTQQPNESGLPPDLGSEPITPVTFDVPGLYTVQLQVSGGHLSDTATIGPFEVTAYASVALTSAFDDAEIDHVNDRIVTVQGTTLSLIDSSGSETNVTLPVPALAVSVSSNGQYAAVAHDAWVSYVELNSLTVLATHPVPLEVADIVLDDTGFAHCFGTGQWINPVSVNLTTGEVVNGSGTVRGGTRARLHTSGQKMYGANNGLSPSDVERYAINQDGSYTVEYDSPYHGDFPFCGDLWLHPAGELLLSRCRVITRTSEDTQTDLSFVAQLEGESSQQIQHASVDQFTNSWLVAFRAQSWNDGGDTFIQMFDAETRVAGERLDLPYLDEVADNRWHAEYVFGLPASSKHYVLAVDDPANPQAYALLIRQTEELDNVNLPPVAEVQRYMTTRQAIAVTLDAAGSSDPEGQSLAYNWTLVSQPIGSTVDISADADSVQLQFMPQIPGSYELELQVNDGVRNSPIARASVNVFANDEDLVHRLEGELRDVEFSKSLGLLVVAEASGLRLIDIASLTEAAIDLGLPARQVGLSPDGLMAAVSHAGTATLVDLQTQTIVDTQTYADDWGDIVLDANQLAHVVPNRDQWSYLYSLDFVNDASDRVYGARAGTQIRMHPIENWVYGADRGLSPSDIEKWDTSTFPATSEGDSPYHGTYYMGGNVWISEDGDRLVVAGGNTFNASSDDTVDMTYSGAVADTPTLNWADHSTERDEWAMVAAENADASFRGLILFYDDVFFQQVDTIAVQAIPATGGAAPAQPVHVFYSDDGSTVYTILNADSLLDRHAIQISDR